MKKKYLMKTALLCLLTASVMLSGCGKPDAENKPEEATEETEKPDEESDEDEPVVHEYPEREYEALLLAKNNNANEITIYSTAIGSSVTVNRKDLFEDFSISDKEFYKLYDEENYDSSSLECAGGDFLFFSDTGRLGGDDEYGYFVYAVNINNGKVYDVWTGKSDSYIQACEYYDDKLYIDYFLGTGDDGSSLGYTEICFKYDDDSDTFEESRLKIAGIVEDALADGIILRGSSSGPNYKSTSLTHAYDECRFILGNDDNGYVTVDRKGNVTELDTPDNIYAYAYNAKSLIYMQYDDSYVHGQVCIYDIESGEAHPISEESKSATFLGQRENNFYYALDKTEEYGLTHYYIYKYDSDEDESTLLYDEEYVPGTGVQPGIEGFTIGDSFICYIKPEGDDLKWVLRSTDFPSEVDTICDLSEIDIFRYGTVDYISNTAVCDKCGTPLVNNYYEYFILDDSMSDYADEINEILHDAADFGAATGEVIEDVDDDECAEHKEHPEWYLETDNVNVSDVKIISDNYLAVNTSGYWYAGGAHGYPSRNQHLFDLTTGEVLTINNFYSESEKEFKELVAEKTREDYLSYDYYDNPYFAQDEETVYKDAYGYAGLDSGCIEFTEDGIIYYYPPYNMGPYASGFIDIFISYEELLGRDHL